MDTEKENEYEMLEVGDIMQIKPHVEMWGGLLMCVTEPKKWGAQGYLYMHEILHACRYNGVAFVRIKHSDMDYIGQIKYLPGFLVERLEEEKEDGDGN